MVYVPAIKWIMFIFFIFLMMEKIIIRTLIKTRLLEIYGDEEDMEKFFDWLYSYKYQGKIKKICMWGLKTMLILFVVLILLCD